MRDERRLPCSKLLRIP
jgi:excisionase family DNA binding protein